jgi:hypothetical protein
MEINDFLVYLSGVGVIVAVSWLWEFFGWFPNAEPKSKKLILFGISVAVALSAYAVKTYVPVDVINQIAPFFGIVALIFVNLFAGEGFHQVTKLKE